MKNDMAFTIEGKVDSLGIPCSALDPPNVTSGHYLVTTNIHKPTGPKHLFRVNMQGTVCGGWSTALASLRYPSYSTHVIISDDDVPAVD